MQRWWISDPTEKNKLKNQTQENAKKSKDNEETGNLETWKFKVFVNFELNPLGK